MKHTKEQIDMHTMSLINKGYLEVVEEHLKMYEALKSCLVYIEHHNDYPTFEENKFESNIRSLIKEIES